MAKTQKFTSLEFYLELSTATGLGVEHVQGKGSSHPFIFSSFVYFFHSSFGFMFSFGLGGDAGGGGCELVSYLLV